MTRTILTFGALSGVVMVVMMFLTMPLMKKENFDYGQWLGYGTMIIALSMIFFGVRSFRDQQSGGVITFGRAFQVGLGIGLLASIFYVAGWMIYYHTGAGEALMDQYFESALNEIRQSGKPAEVIQQEVSKMLAFREQYNNPIIMIGVTFMEIFPVALIVDLIAALLLRRKEAIAA